jgi:hypothetical protein
MKSKIQLILGSILLGLAIFLFSCEKVTLEVDDSQIPATVSFSEHIVPIFESKCIGCHNGTYKFDLRASAAYNSLVNNGLITQGSTNPSASGFYNQVKTGHGGISALEVQIIKRWIEQGSQNN